jgi:hypothetical protein
MRPDGVIERGFKSDNTGYLLAALPDNGGAISCIGSDFTQTMMRYGGGDNFVTPLPCSESADSTACHPRSAR